MQNAKCIYQSLTFEPTPKSHFLKFTAKSVRRKESKINDLYFSVFASWRWKNFFRGDSLLHIKF